MTTAVIADAHLGGPEDSAGVEGFVAQLEKLPGRGCRRLLFLGDIFHVWVGDRRFETPEIRRVLPALERLRQHGVRLDYVEGNRDFFLASSPYAELFDSVGDELAFEAGGVRYLAVHGDGLNDRDRQYRFWRRLSKSLPVRLAIRWLPGRVAHSVMHTVEDHLSGTNFKHKVRIPEEVIAAYGERRLVEGHDVLLLGHFHKPRTWRVPGGEIRLLEAWYENHKIEWLEPSVASPSG